MLLAKGWGGLLIALVAACAPLQPQPREAKPVPADSQDMASLSPVTYAFLPGWTEDDHGAAIPALQRSCKRRLAGRDASKWRAICTEAAQLSATDHRAARAFFERRFVPHSVAAGGRTDGLFTGYYEAELDGSWQPSERYRVPIHARPGDLVTAELGKFRKDLKGKHIVGRVSKGRLVPYDTRAEIAAGGLSGRASELLWVDDPIDAFFLHIQGSGRVRMTDGRIVRVGYAGKNGRPYVAIGRNLIARGEIAREHMSMQAIRDWLRRHPAEGRALMAKNPSYVFFRIVEGEGPIGAEGVPLTPGRSLAVDRRHISLGLPVWLDTTYPSTPPHPLRRLVVAQDTGGVIKGAVRGDLFWGFGDEAAAWAGHMKQTGRYFVLLPRTR